MNRIEPNEKATLGSKVHWFTKKIYILCVRFYKSTITAYLHIYVFLAEVLEEKK